jgi:hypothetical protein
MALGFAQDILGRMHEALVHDMFVHLVDMVALESNLLGIIIQVHTIEHVALMVWVADKEGLAFLAELD